MKISVGRGQGSLKGRGCGGAPTQRVLAWQGRFVQAGQELVYLHSDQGQVTFQLPDPFIEFHVLSSLARAVHRWSTL